VAQLLNTSVTVEADASGTARARIGPDSAKGPAHWTVTNIGVRNADPARRGQTPIPTCNTYVDSEDANGWISGTYDGSFDVDSDVNIDLSRGQVVIAVWEGAQAGDDLTLSVSGTKEG